MNKIKASEGNLQISKLNNVLSNLFSNSLVLKTYSSIIKLDVTKPNKILSSIIFNNNILIPIKYLHTSSVLMKTK